MVLLKRSISSEEAAALIEAALFKAAELGISPSITILDESNVLKAFLRSDGAKLATVQGSQDKAFTAAGMGYATHEWYPIIEKDPPLLHGMPTAIQRLVIYGGGVPLRVDGEVVGGIGVAGGSHHQDREIAEAGAAALAAFHSDTTLREGT
jgi:uncharacterized protein GlcG (DUF336 family)